MMEINDIDPDELEPWVCCKSRGTSVTDLQADCDPWVAPQ